jgi:hypothetical protein
VKRLTPDDTAIIPYSIDRYRRLLKFGEGLLGLSVGWTPHSPRAGFASEGRANGKLFVELREEGRWLHDASLRIYIDQVSTAAIGVSLKQAGLGPAVAWAVARWLDYCPHSSLLLGVIPRGPSRLHRNSANVPHLSSDRAGLAAS